MGNTIAKVQAIIDTPRLMGTRLAVDLCENIHLHYRDLRLEFSITEWKAFVDFITYANKYIQENHADYDMKDPNYFGQVGIVIPAQSESWPGRVNVEIQGEPFGGIMHIHYNDLRIELPVDVYKQLAHLINRLEVRL